MKRLPTRFSKKIEISKDGCWIWVAYSTRSGYGQFGVGKKLWYSHRFAYTLLRGEIPEGKVLDHFRLNPGPRNAPCSTKCCNPEHLEVTSRGENVKRADLSRNGENSRTKTHCPQGHEYTTKNTRITCNRRTCVICRKKQSKEYYLRKNKMKEDTDE